MRKKMRLFGFALCLLFLFGSCSKNSHGEPTEKIDHPQGTWTLIRTGGQAGDGTYSKWVWTDVKPAKAYKIEFKEDNRFISHEKTPFLTGTYTFSNHLIEINLPEDKENSPLGKTLKGALENDIITLRYLIGADGAIGLQFQFSDHN